MAFTQEGLFGKFSGRLGSMVVYQMKGKTVVRTRPGKWTAQPSKKQQQARSNFTQVLKVLQAIRPYIDVTYGSISEQSALRNAQSANLKRIRVADDSSSLSWLLPSSGTRAGATDVKGHVDNHSMSITWGDALTGPYQDDDTAMILAINVHSLEVAISRSRRDHHQAEVKLPGDVSDVAVYLAFAKKDVQKKEMDNASQAMMVTTIA